MLKTENRTTKTSNYSTDAPTSLKVLYDGNCAMCLGMVHHFSKLTTAIDVEWIPVLPITPKEKSELRFRIIDDQNNEYFDTDARLLLLKAYPRYRVLGALVSYPYLRWIINPVFSFVAANRYRISSMLAYFGLAERKNTVGSSECDGHCKCLDHRDK